MAVRKTAAPKKAAAPAKAETVTSRQMIADLAGRHGYPKKTMQDIVDDLLSTISNEVVAGKRVRLNGIGVLFVRHRPARMGRNPATGEAIKLKASKKVTYRAAKELKEAIA